MGKDDRMDGAWSYRDLEWPGDEAASAMGALRRAGYAAWYRPLPVEKGPDGRYRAVHAGHPVSECGERACGRGTGRLP